MKYKIILFDADGVLIKSSRQFSERLAADHGISTEKMQPFFTGVFRECSVGKADLKDELARVIDDWGWKGTVDELLHFWFTKGTEIDDKIAAFISELRRFGVRTYMTTDQEKYRGEHLRKTLVSGNIFDGVFFSAEVGCSKKDQSFMKYVYSAINKISRSNSSPLVKKDCILFVDDGEKNIESAKQFGFDTHLFTNLDDLKQRLSE